MKRVCAVEGNTWPLSLFRLHLHRCGWGWGRGRSECTTLHGDCQLNSSRSAPQHHCAWLPAPFPRSIPPLPSLADHAQKPLADHAQKPPSAPTSSSLHWVDLMRSSMVRSASPGVSWSCCTWPCCCPPCLNPVPDTCTPPGPPAQVCAASSPSLQQGVRGVGVGYGAPGEEACGGAGLKRHAGKKQAWGSARVAHCRVSPAVWAACPPAGTPSQVQSQYTMLLAMCLT